MDGLMAFDGRLVANVGVLAAIVESGSLAKAADVLGLSASGVSRALARLEQRIGVRLLDRTTRALSLTDEGRRLYAEIGPLLTGIEDVVAQTAGAATAVRGRLRVNVDAFFARLLLAPHLDRFLERYTDLTLELTARDQLGDLVGEGFDVAIRFGEPPASSLVTRKLLETRTATLASPAYLERRGRPAHPRDLEGHACIQMRHAQTGEPLPWVFQKDGEAFTVPTSGRLAVNEVGSLMGACLAGVGVARVKAIGVLDLIAHGELIDLFPDWPGETFPLYALYPSRHLPAAKVRAFVDFVAEVVVA
jgi:DNA-binding transcriptional LysR family regulator